MPFNKMLREFIQLESKSTILLLSAAFFAVVISNSPLSAMYNQFVHYSFSFHLGHLEIHTSTQLFVNEVLMTIFFFLIGLEMKREVLIGEMNSRRKILLPFIASMSGMLMAGITYLIINGNMGVTARGWAIPTATDVALSSSVLLLLGRRVPSALRLFLMMLAIIDDIIAAGIIAIFYSHDFNVLFLLLAILCLLMLFLLNRGGFSKYILYAIFGTLLWLCILEANISPPVSGVLIAFTIPLKSNHKNKPSLLQELEHTLHPYVAFLILPIFVFVNAGLSFAHVSWAMFFQPLTLGIMLGLFLGKQIGVFTSCWFAVKTKIAHLPESISWQQFYGMSVLCGIGFTMNLFIGFLAFPRHEAYLALVKLGILSAAVLSALTGYCILRLSKKKVS